MGVAIEGMDIWYMGIIKSLIQIPGNSDLIFCSGFEMAWFVTLKTTECAMLITLVILLCKIMGIYLISPPHTQF